MNSKSQGRSSEEKILLRYGLNFLGELSAAQLLTHRCMGKTCGFAAVPAATAAQQPDRVGDFQSRKSTANQGEK